MKIKELLVGEDQRAMKTRFRRSAKTTALLDGQPANPKKILNMIQQSLNKATGYNFRLTPKYIEDEGFWALYEYNFGEYTVEIEVEISWYDDQMYSGTIEKPMIRIVIERPIRDRKTLSHYRKAVTTEWINTMWDDESIDDIHIATNPSKKWSEFGGHRT